MLLSDEDIVRQIEKGSEEEGVQHAVRLVRGNCAYLPVLLRLLRDAKEQSVRERIAIALGELGIATKDVLGTLWSRLTGDIYVVRQAAAEALVKLKPAEAKDFINRSASSDKEVVEILSQALAKVGVRDAISTLVKAVEKFPNSYLCLESLIRLAGNEAPKYVLEAFHRIPQDKQDDFLRWALRYVCTYGQSDVVPVLQRLRWTLTPAQRLQLLEPIMSFYISSYCSSYWESLFHHYYHHPFHCHIHFDFGFDFNFHLTALQAEEAWARWRCMFVNWFPFFRPLYLHLRMIEREQKLKRLESAGQELGFPFAYRWYLPHMQILTMLSVETHVAYEEVNVLRFAALMELATTRDGASIEQVINEASQSREAARRLLEREAECDRLREEIAVRRGWLRELLEEEAHLFGELEREERGRSEEVQAEVRHISEEIEALNQRLDGQGEGPLAILRHETERLLPVLRERGVTFRRLVIEGVLGEYDFVEHKVTLYPPMIELAAQDLLRDGLVSGGVEELTAVLNTVVGIHETAHANLHLGKDSDGKQWVNFTQGSVALHEGLAQFYTLALIKQVGDKKLEKAFKALSTKQPEEYTLWSVLEPCSLESVRWFVLAQRSGRRLTTIFEVAAEAMQAVAANCQWLQQRTGEVAWQAFIAQLESIVPELEQAKSPLQLANACDHLLTACASFPAIKRLLDAILVGGFPSEEERCLLQMAAVSQKPSAPDAYSRTTLRAISMEAAMMEVTLSPEEIGIGQDIRKAIDTVKVRSRIKPKPPKKPQKGSQPTK